MKSRLVIVALFALTLLGCNLQHPSMGIAPSSVNSSSPMFDTDARALTGISAASANQIKGTWSGVTRSNVANGNHGTAVVVFSLVDTCTGNCGQGGGNGGGNGTPNEGNGSDKTVNVTADIKWTSTKYAGQMVDVHGTASGTLETLVILSADVRQQKVCQFNASGTINPQGTVYSGTYNIPNANDPKCPKGQGTFSVTKQ